jgi:hypothetical protein
MKMARFSSNPARLSSTPPLEGQIKIDSNFTRAIIPVIC